MACIASALEDAGYTVFLPQRDGLELAKLLPKLIEKDFSLEDASKILNMAIFDLDVFQIIDSQGFILNMNGRVPDEGAMVEAGIAWSRKKQLVIYKNDDRSLVQGNCNPLVMGLSDFVFISSYEEIPEAFYNKFSNTDGKSLSIDESPFEISCTKGKEISEYLATEKSIIEISDLLLNLFGDVICKISKDQKMNFSQAKKQP